LDQYFYAVALPQACVMLAMRSQMLWSSLLFVWHVNAVHLRISENKRRGNEIGDAILQSSSQEVDDRPLTPALADTLAFDQAVLVNPKVSKVVAEANRLSEHQGWKLESLCTRNWGSSCPDGWDGSGDSGCTAPSSYAGGCATHINLAKADMAGKQKFAEECQAPWPCQDDCVLGHDYDACPSGWERSQPGFCTGASPNGCAQLFKFDEMQTAQKQELASVCGFSWPCKSECQEFRSRCPEGWQLEGSTCLAPSSYSGACASEIDTSGMSSAQKKELGTKCGVKFGC